MLKTFSIGGVHPHENKLSAHQPIIKAEIPAKAAILLGQHIGAPAKPIVAKGDVVKVGTKIAEPGGFVSAAIHSSVSGKVAKIDTIVDASDFLHDFLGGQTAFLHQRFGTVNGFFPFIPFYVNEYSRLGVTAGKQSGLH